ncbi:HNH endonuclease signature motif containing protein [Serinicoccus sp. LYQ131]|uniref:HNH endonuclease signature motif containing protein n=1 Tax=Serinicoccus sp. LYQ131 TaxID=3378797 RepID=UPI003853DF9A
MSELWGGEVVRGRAAEVLREGLPAAAPVGEVLLGTLRSAQRELALGVLAGMQVGELADADVEAGLEAVGRAQGLVVRARLRLACEVAQRGLHVGSGFGLADWLQVRCPELEAPVVRDLARLADASRQGVHAPLVDAVLDGGMPIARAARIHRATERIRGGLTPAQHQDAVELLTETATDGVFQDKDVQRVIDEVVRRCLPEREHEDRARAQRELRDLHESSLAGGSVRRMVLTFGDDADYEAVRAIITSPLAAPASLEEQQATGQPEMRTPGQRRYDAFMTVLTRGVAGSQGQPVTPKAKLIVTMDLEALRRQVGTSSADGAPGAGAALEGASIAASVIRRLACEAEIIPMVLGGPSEIVDQGRARRLVTPGQRLQLAVRDRGCTIPGCTVPATWCDAHHVVHWARGGRSDLSNYALVCPRHHTFVHEHDHSATIDELGVRWHLR